MYLSRSGVVRLSNEIASTFVIENFVLIDDCEMLSESKILKQMIELLLDKEKII